MHMVSIALYVDVNLIEEDTEVIDEVSAALKKNGLVLKIVEGLQE